ncbi:MAG: CHAD domain-containing protein [Alphaproteobacteria bacterium]|nr:CHAD domain-containing protein [Alphaproteobacteria bacterium]
MHYEIELKLALAPEHVGRVLDAPVVAAHAARGWRSQVLTSTYFDTPDRALWAQGMAIRVRAAGKRRVQTLKVPLAADGTAQRFREYEARIAGDRPDPIALPADETCMALVTGGVFDRLEPVFTTVFRRRIRRVAFDAATIEIALDTGTIEAGPSEAGPIEAGAASIAVSEIELELIEGPEAALYDLALALLALVPLRIEAETKAARGMALAAGRTPPAAVRAKAAALDEAMSVGEALGALTASCLRQLRDNEPVVVGTEDPEGVHQMRVAIRRLRALLDAFKPTLAADVFAHLRDELRWLQQALGPAREWDVFIAETIDRMIHRMPEEKSLQALRDRALEMRAEAYRAARAAIGTPRYTALLLRLERHRMGGSWLAAIAEEAPVARSVETIADRTLARHDKRLRRLGADHDRLTLPELHDVRIRAKKLRYAVEFFRDLYARGGKRTWRKYARALADIQDALGAINDTVETERLLGVIGAARPAGANDDAARAAAIVTGWEAARVEIGLARFPGVWRSYRKSKPFWDR